MILLSPSIPTIPNRVGSSTSQSASVPIPPFLSCKSIPFCIFKEEMMSPLRQANFPEITSRQFPSAPPVPNGSVSFTIRTSNGTSFSLKYCSIISTLYPPATTTSSTLSLGMTSTTCSSNVLSNMGRIGFGIP